MIRSAPREAELKLRCRPRELRALAARLVKLIRNPLESQLLRATYFDTQDQALRRQRVGLRVRREGRQWIQTVKGGGQVQAGLATRTELNHVVSSSAVHLEALPQDGALGALLRRVRRRLVPVFQTSIRRRKAVVTYDGARIEVALDSGTLIASSRRERVSEVELELVDHIGAIRPSRARQARAIHPDGSPAALYRLASLWAQDFTLIPDNRSKAQRGYDLWSPEEPRVKKILSVLPRGKSGLVRELVSVVMENEALARGGNAEAVAETSQAIWMMAAALRSRRGDSPHIGVELEWLGGMLARTQHAHPSDRSRTHRALVEALESARYGRVLLALGAFGFY